MRLFLIFLIALAGCGKVEHVVSGKAVVEHVIDLKFCYEFPAGEKRQECISDVLEIMTGLKCK